MPERTEKEGLKQTNFWFDSNADSNAAERQRTISIEL
jgi:hypothetical protein